MYPGERLNGYSHLAGLVLAAAGAAWLLDKAGESGSPERTIAALTFAGSVISLYTASTLFHSTRGAAKRFWQRADHAAIYVLIAGTVTPFALFDGARLWNYAALIAIWILAGVGLWRELRARPDDRALVWPYVLMGWMGVFIAASTASRAGVSALLLLLGGAALYTAGTVFYRNRRGYAHAHGAWHLLVMGGTTAHYVAIGCYVL